MRVLVTGGGGVANLRQNVLFLYADFAFPDFTFLDFSAQVPIITGPFVPIEFQMVERRSSGSENALCLNAGGIVEYAWGAHLSIGVDARYTHDFFNRDGLDLARVAARATWGF